MVATTTTLLDLPIVCLETANFDLTIGQVVQQEGTNKHTVIDFWTTKCTRCPAALDKMQQVAASANNDTNIQFMSICCDKLDGARNILENTDTPRWKDIRHYYMSFQDKEYAKQLLQFRSVPFYVILNNASGEISYTGNTIDWERLPTLLGVVPPQQQQEEVEARQPEDDVVVAVSPKTTTKKNSTTALITPSQKKSMTTTSTSAKPTAVRLSPFTEMLQMTTPNKQKKKKKSTADVDSTGGHRSNKGAGISRQGSPDTVLVIEDLDF